MLHFRLTWWIYTPFSTKMECMWYDRNIKYRIKKSLERGKSILLLGPRQTGKTSLVKSFTHDAAYNFIDPQVRQRFERSPGSLIPEVEALAQISPSKPCLILDEIQKVPELMDALQLLIDKNIAQFIITGSSARKLQNLLPGRVIRYQMDPLTLPELTNFQKGLNFLLENGTLPYITTLDDPTAIEEELETYVTTYLEEEIRKEALVRNLSAFTQFFNLACIDSGNLVNFRKLSQEIGIAHTTIAEYYRILEDCMVAERFEPITKTATRRRLTKSPKYLLFDLGVRRVGAGEGTRLSQRKMAEIFEQWVGLELRRLTRTAGHATSVHFWRAHDGPEVDWVLQLPDRYIPIEVKWTDTPKLNDARHLSLFMKEYPNTPRAYIICRAPKPLLLSENIMALPWQELVSVCSEIKC